METEISPDCQQQLHKMQGLVELPLRFEKIIYQKICSHELLHLV